MWKLVVTQPKLSYCHVIHCCEVADGIITLCTIADYSAVAVAKKYCGHSKECDACKD